jgi:hypothetical protein
VVPASAIQPRATIRLPDDAPRFRKRMQVFAPSAPRTERYLGQSCSNETRVLTVRGESSDGTLIRVLPKDAPVLAQAPETPVAPHPKPQTRLASTRD